jgi:hypothetical protein
MPPPEEPSPPHRRRDASVSVAASLVARGNHHRSSMISPSGALHLGRRRGRANAPPRQAAYAAGPGRWSEAVGHSATQHCEPEV